MNALFDLDGTLCDPREGIALGFRHAFAAVGRPFPGDADVAAQIGRPLLECFRALGCGSSSAEAARHFQDFFKTRGFAEARLYEGVLECLRYLRLEGWGLALASSKPAEVVRLVARDLDLLPFLDGVYGCGSEDLSPDKRAIAREAMKNLAWSATDTVFVGDRDQDREAAEALGLPFIAAAWGFGGPEEHSGALAVAASLPDLGVLLARHATVLSPKRHGDFL